MNTRTKVLSTTISILLVAAISVYQFSDSSSEQGVRKQERIQTQHTLQKLDSDFDKESVDTPTTQDARYDGPKDQTLTIKQISAQEYQRHSAYGALPYSLQGTSIPPLFVDTDGNLIKNKSNRQFIEYFLGAAREESNAVVIARAHEYFNLALEEPALSQAYELLQNYIDYTIQLDAITAQRATFSSSNDKVAAIKETLAQRRSLRRETLGEETAQAMFGASEQYESYTVKVMEINQNDELSPQEKETLIIQHEENLPTRIKERISYYRKSKAIEQEIKELRKEEGNEQKIYQLRESFYGQQNAEKWAFIEDRSSEWQVRVNEFNHSKSQILASVMLNDDQKREQIELIRDRDFNEEEKLKLAWQSLQ